MRRIVFRRLYATGDYPLGWEWNLGPYWKSQVFRIVHVKVSKILEMERYVTIITIWGKDYIKQ
jgi:hypothetical protein